MKWPSVPPVPPVCHAGCGESRLASRRPRVIEAVTPVVDCGRYAVKRVVAEPCVVEADIFRDGDHVLHALIK